MVWYHINLLFLALNNPGLFLAYKNSTISEVIPQDSSPSCGDSVIASFFFSILWFGHLIMGFPLSFGKERRELEGCDLALMVWPGNSC